MAMAYLVEVYNRSCPVEKNFLHTALFITFFPDRTGRSDQPLFPAQAADERAPDDSRSCWPQGIRRFIIGLGKKALLADTLAKTADQIFAVPVSGLSGGLSWLGAICYTPADFS